MWCELHVIAVWNEWEKWEMEMSTIRCHVLGRKSFKNHMDWRWCFFGFTFVTCTTGHYHRQITNMRESKIYLNKLFALCLVIQPHSMVNEECQKPNDTLCLPFKMGSASIVWSRDSCMRPYPAIDWQRLIWQNNAERHKLWPKGNYEIWKCHIHEPHVMSNWHRCHSNKELDTVLAGQKSSVWIYTRRTPCDWSVWLEEDV